MATVLELDEPHPDPYVIIPIWILLAPLLALLLILRRTRNKRPA